MELGKGQYNKSLSNRTKPKKHKYGCANYPSNNNHRNVAFEDCVCRFNPQKSDCESDPRMLRKSSALVIGAHPLERSIQFRILLGKHDVA